MAPVYEITDEHKERLREPRGDVVQGDELIEELRERDYRRLICVGDRVSLDVAKSDVDADIYVVDGKIEREPVDGEHEQIDTELRLEADNPAGAITEAAWNTVREAFAHTCSVTLHVDGEEDLLALPSIVFASPDSLIVYGDWENGAVILVPDAELKEFARDLVGFEQFPRVIVGGTWDRFHAGHRYLLLAALENGKHVDVGVTTNEYVEENGAKDVESFEERRDSVTTFLKQEGRFDDVELMPIDDFRGNAVDVDRAVLMVTQETLGNAKKINEERLEQRKTPLNIAALEQITATDGQPISATRIRNGEIDQNGVVSHK